ncbi:hypothetical protein SmJEL517_g00533 [Synchytrium microbalum]|uniref:RING-type E3 ubiquitin transferase n=1 Tax=Synchytrium microbalum TaxID=1806994 RepID=A0A507CI04_9FUNG|nr:uncharacterized protein SmJEL517_g00533 [Synchytrium microbalum]TPX37704.1 hypothetical protein SmJEL517_g00533 [Synchytrium microbalum]
MSSQDDKPRDENCWGLLSSSKQTAAFPDVPLKSQQMLYFGRSSNSFGQIGSSLSLSAKHFRLHLDFNGRVTLTDSSTNGTFLNDERLEKLQSRIVSDGDTIYMSKVDPSLPDYTVKLYKERISTLTHSSSSPGPSSGLKRPFTALMANQSDDEDVFSDGLTQKVASSSNDEKIKKQKQMVEDEKDELEEILTCGICQDLLFQAVSAVPCLHNFCGACFSAWIDKCKPMAPECPNCRTQCKLVKKNHTIASLADTFLKAHPEKARPAAEQEDMKARNKIDGEMKLSNDYDASIHDSDEDSAADEMQVHLPDAAEAFNKISSFNLRNIGAAFNHNIFENVVFQEYLRAKNMDVPQFYQSGINKLRDKTWKIEMLASTGQVYVPQRPGSAIPPLVQVDPDAYACILCASKILAEMAFLCRKETPKAELPESERLLVWEELSYGTAQSTAC